MALKDIVVEKRTIDELRNRVEKAKLYTNQIMKEMGIDANQRFIRYNLSLMQRVDTNFELRRALKSEDEAICALTNAIKILKGKSNVKDTARGTRWEEYNQYLKNRDEKKEPVTELPKDR